MTNLQDACLLITDGKHGDCQNEEGSGYYFISCKDVRDGWVDYSGARQITEADYYDTHKRTQLEPNDILITNSGTIGRMALVPDRPETYRTTFQKSVAIIKPNQDRATPKWLYYHLTANRDALIAWAGGTAQKNLLLRDLRAFEVHLPPLPTQRKIAATLSAYDDLIENNTRRIALLEEMAHRLYREWFVRFRFPGHESVRLVDSSQGPIPEGWVVKPVGELLSYHIGGGWGEGEFSNKHSVPAYVIRGTDIPEARHIHVVNCPLRYHKLSNFDSRKLYRGDIVFEVSGGSKGQPVGRALLISQRLLAAFDAEVICASFCKLLRVNPEILIPELLYLHLLEIYDNGQIEKYEVQSTGIKNFKFAFFLEDQMIVVPPKHLQAQFSSIAVPAFEQIQTLGMRNANLRRTRDLLLPRLVSGALDVAGLDIAIGD
jgi:type I restriction enzyme S subunit